MCLCGWREKVRVDLTVFVVVCHEVWFVFRFELLGVVESSTLSPGGLELRIVSFR